MWNNETKDSSILLKQNMFIHILLKFKKIIEYKKNKDYTFLEIDLKKLDII